MLGQQLDDVGIDNLIIIREENANICAKFCDYLTTCSAR